MIPLEIIHSVTHALPDFAMPFSTLRNLILRKIGEIGMYPLRNVTEPHNVPTLVLVYIVLVLSFLVKYLREGKLVIDSKKIKIYNLIN